MICCQSWCMEVDRKSLGSVCHEKIQDLFPITNMEFSFLCLFQQSRTAVNVTLAAIVDPTPETSAVYNFTLLSISTSGISTVPAMGGAAVLDTTENVAIVTLRASNNPHGVVALNQDSLTRTVTESMTNVTLTVVRQFGTIGKPLCDHAYKTKFSYWMDALSSRGRRLVYASLHCHIHRSIFCFFCQQI